MHSWFRERAVLGTATVFVRLLLAVGFIHAGLRKVTGSPFMNPGSDSDIGRFFDAFFASGEFYAFIGWAQIAAGVLLMIPRTALLGAVVYFPIVLNILVITISMRFTGTWIVALFMTAANLYLLFWDAHRLRPIVQRTAEPIRDFEAKPHSRKVLWVIAGGSSGFAFLSFGTFFLAATGRLPAMVSWAAVPAFCLGLAVGPLAAGAVWQLMTAGLRPGQTPPALGRTRPADSVERPADSPSDSPRRSTDRFRQVFST